MGWMNDSLSYMSVDPYFRKGCHDKLTFSMMYAFSENFILPVSHDEVVHGKKSLLDKMAGEYDDKFANNRAFLGYMMAHPGKKLTFMGEEFGQFKEWDYKEGVEFFMTVYPLHYKLLQFYKAINFIYKEHEAFYTIDDGWNGFEWLDVDNALNNVLAFKRVGKNGEEIIAIISFNGADIENYKLNVDARKCVVILNSDDKAFGGSGKIRKKVYVNKRAKDNKKRYELEIYMPKLSCVYLKKL